MKKILCLLLAVIMAFGLAACGENNNSSTPTNTPSNSQPTETQPTGTQDGTGQGNTDMPEVPEGSWVIKNDIEAPVFAAPQKVTDEVSFTVADAFFTMELYQADWSQKNPEKVMNELKKMPIFEGWTWSVQKEERGYGKIYSDVGEQRNFEYSVTIQAEKQIDYISHRISISFSGKTNAYSGWRGISVNYSTPDIDMGAVQQEAILPVLQVVYGNAADYMVYAPVTDERYSEMSFENKNDLGSEKISRKLDENSVRFSWYAYTNLENSFEQYTGDYIPMLGDNEPQYYRDIFKNFGSMNFNEIEKVGSEFLGKHLTNYHHTAPGTYEKLYNYTVTEYENGDKDVEFSIDMLIYQKDASYIEGMTLELKYTVEVRNDIVNVKRAEIHIPALCEEWDDNDTENPAVNKRLNDNLTYAKQVANAIFNTDFDFAEVYWNGGSDYELFDSYKTKMFGREVTIRFEFNTKTMDSIGKNRASFTISIS